MDGNNTVVDNFDSAKTQMSKSSSNLIFYNNAFSKTKFMTKIMDSFHSPILYLDFDLLLSGYFESDIIPKPLDIEVMTPDSITLKELLPNVLAKVSLQETVLILDSLNGLYSFLNDKNPGRFVNSLIMLLSTNLKFSKSILFVTCLAQKKEDVWVLPNGRHILEFENINRFEINENDMKSEIQPI